MAPPPTTVVQRSRTRGFCVAVRSEVIVRIQWADPERSGLRSLRFHARSLESACELIARGVGAVVVDDEAPPARATPPRARRKAAREKLRRRSHDVPHAAGNGHTPAPSSRDRWSGSAMSRRIAAGDDAGAGAPGAHVLRPPASPPSSARHARLPLRPERRGHAFDAELAKPPANRPSFRGARLAR